MQLLNLGQYLVCFVTALGICFSSCGQSVNYNQGGTNSKNYYQEIPYQMINGKLFVEVTIHHRRALFMLDTGAPTQLTPGLAKELNSVFLSSTVATDANGHQDSLKAVWTDSLMLGNVMFNNVPALIVASELYDCWEIEGVIGSNLLRNSILKIDPVKKVLILTDDEKKLGLSKDHSTKLILAKNSQSSPILKIDLSNRVNLEVEFDSGDNGFLMLSQNHIKQLAQFKAFKITERGFGAVHRSIYGLQKMDSTYRLLFPTVTIAGVTFKHAVVETITNTTPRIGTTLLNYGAVTLDYKNSRFYFDANANSIDLPQKRWPVNFTVQGQQLIAGVVWGDMQNQIAPGNQITAVNNIPLPNITFCKWLNSQSPLQDLEKATLTVKNAQGKLKQVYLIQD